jgi:catechol 2,3-dioxygenase-like lactoylglutathione lyase family enzyme
MATASKPAIAFGGVNPVLRVSDIAVSKDYYTRVLGFKIDFETPGYFVAVSRGRCGLFLCQGDQGLVGVDRRSGCRSRARGIRRCWS